MNGPEHDTRREEATATRAAAKTPPTGASVLEVAALRERMDGVTMKLGDVDRRVSVLEAARHGDVDSSQSEEQVIPAATGTQSDVLAIGISEIEKGTDVSDAAPSRPKSLGDTRPTVAEGTDASRPPVRVPPSSSVFLMLTDPQFQRWLEGGTVLPPGDGDQTSVGSEREGNRRLRRHVASASR